MLSVVMAAVGVVMWIEGGPHPRTRAAWLPGVSRAPGIVHCQPRLRPVSGHERERGSRLWRFSR
jgi:hypothetical protein